MNKLSKTNKIDVSKKKTEVVYIKIEEGGQRIDNFLMTHLKDIPKSHVYRLLRKGEIRVNKKRIKPEYRLQTDDLLRLPPLMRAERKEKRAPDRLCDLINQQVIYEDKAFLVVNKPPGVAVHGGSGINFGVIEALRQARPTEKYIELAHRLDRETSGCLLLVKKPSILKEVHQLLREGKVDKRYLALLQGKVPFKKEKRINAPLKKFELAGGERVVRSQADGKPSETIFTLLDTFGKLASLVEAKPITGRTHQIRVHALLMGYPIAGDDKYGEKIFNKSMQVYGLKRLFLHSHHLEFTLPSTGKHFKFEAPLASDLEKVRSACQVMD
ncbi:MAG: RluA family pseudouridine synthase [Gammaproteobacteria bacterium]|nr:RluA family pseudouridine synthase [Gammaproteobacteria bacterium]